MLIPLHDRKLIAAFILGMPRMTLDPHKADIMHIEKCQQLLPEIGIKRRLSVGFLPALSLP